ncbi:MAG TPA: hypothetical protein VGS80_03150 [Ktedonobacterales bacterium]|nr:hypothetical protein [Ktedonobacterales bacterium]
MPPPQLRLEYYKQFGNGATLDNGFLVLSKIGRLAVRWSRSPYVGAGCPCLQPWGGRRRRRWYHFIDKYTPCEYAESMKQTLLVKLVPTPAQHAALLRTLEAFNAACNAIADVAYEHHLANKIELQKLVYYDVRQRFGLSSQMGIRAIAKVAEAYKRDKRSKPSFRPHGAMVYDERISNFPTPDRVSLLTLDGRMEVPFRFGRYAEGMMLRA